MIFLYQLVKVFAAVFGVSFFLNLFWEVLHSALYNWNIPPLINSVGYYIPRILQSTLGDAVMISIIFFANALISRDIFWFLHPQAKNFALLIVLGIGFALFIELRAMAENRWSYSEYMPLLFGVGLTPLVQLAITSIFTVCIVKKLYAGGA